MSVATVKVNLTKARRILKEMEVDFNLASNYKTVYETAEEAKGHETNIQEVIQKITSISDEKLVLLNKIYAANQACGIVDLLNEKAIQQKILHKLEELSGRKKQRGMYGVPKHDINYEESFAQSVNKKIKLTQRMIQDLDDKISTLNGTTTIEVPESYLEI